MEFHYSPSEFVKNIWSLVCTKAFNRPARLIRRPVYIRGGRGMEYGPGFTTGYRCRFEMFHSDEGIKLKLGRNCCMGDQVHIVASSSVELGDDCLLASHIFISDTNHGTVNDDPRIPPNARPLVSSPVKIGSRVWIGEGACILPGSQVGDGCIIGAHSVVTGNVPSNSVVVGAPARVIKKYNFETKQMERYQ